MVGNGGITYYYLMELADPEVLDVGESRLIPIMQRLTAGKYLEHLSEVADLADVESVESDSTEVSRRFYDVPGYQAHVDEQQSLDRSIGESFANAAHKAIEDCRKNATIQQFRTDDRIHNLQKVLTKSRSISVKLQGENKKLKSQIRADVEELKSQILSMSRKMVNTSTSSIAPSTTTTTTSPPTPENSGGESVEGAWVVRNSANVNCLNHFDAKPCSTINQCREICQTYGINKPRFPTATKPTKEQSDASVSALMSKTDQGKRQVVQANPHLKKKASIGMIHPGTQSLVAVMSTGLLVNIPDHHAHKYNESVFVGAEESRTDFCENHWGADRLLDPVAGSISLNTKGAKEVMFTHNDGTNHYISDKLQFSLREYVVLESDEHRMACINVLGPEESTNKLITLGCNNGNVPAVFIPDMHKKIDGFGSDQAPQPKAFLSGMGLRTGYAAQGQSTALTCHELVFAAMKMHLKQREFGSYCYKSESGEQHLKKLVFRSEAGKYFDENGLKVTKADLEMSIKVPGAKGLLAMLVIDDVETNYEGDLASFKRDLKSNRKEIFRYAEWSQCCFSWNKPEGGGDNIVPLITNKTKGAHLVDHTVPSFVLTNSFGLFEPWSTLEDFKKYVANDMYLPEGCAWVLNRT
jgi:hypothetical protein